MPQRDFFQDVYDVVRLIPRGRVCTYGAIANYLGAKKSSRMVGWAMNQSHTEKPVVPAHRVVNRNGLLTGKHHFSNENTMEEKLKEEGIAVQDDRIVDLTKYFWDPKKHLSL